LKSKCQAFARNLLGDSTFSFSVKPNYTMSSRYFHVVSPRNDVSQAIPFEVSCEANEPLIAAAGDADDAVEEKDAEEEDHRLEKSCLPASSSLHCSLDCFWVSLFS
jgi:hypothetical protein